MTHTDQNRAEFEHWVMRNPRPGTHLGRSRNGEYKDNRVKAKWGAWQAALDHKAADVVLPEPVAWMLGYQTMGGDVGWKLSFSQSGAGVCHRLNGEQFEQPLHTEQQVRTLLAGVKDSLTVALAVPQGWIPVSERLPEPGRPVLLDIGKKHPIRAMWAARFTLEAGDDDPDWGEYDEDGDMYYCPQGWYEWNEHEDTHWRVHADPIRWAELPQPPKEQT